MEQSCLATANQIEPFSKYSQYILDNYMTISFKIAFWIGCENLGINYLIDKCQSRRQQQDKGKVTQAKKFG